MWYFFNIIVNDIQRKLQSAKQIIDIFKLVGQFFITFENTTFGQGRVMECILVKKVSRSKMSESVPNRIQIERRSISHLAVRKI